MNGTRAMHDVKGFLADKLNRLTVIVIILGIFLIGSLYKINAEITNLKHLIIKCEKKVDFRYFNLTRSLEQIHNVEIDTLNGRIIK